MNIVMFLAGFTAKPLPAVENPLTVMLRFLVGIVVVSLLLWLLYRWMRRTNLGDYEGPGLRLISRLALTRSAMVAVVEIGGRMFLVGAGDSAVTPIAELYDTAEMSVELDSQAAALAAAQARAAARKPVKKPFSQVLARVNRKGPQAGSSRPQSAPVRVPPPGPSGSSGSPGSSGKTTGAVIPPKPQVTEAQMDALAAQIAAEFGVKSARAGESS